MLALPDAEVLLTFSTDALIDHLSEQPVLRKTLIRIGLEGFAESITEHIQRRSGSERHAVQCVLSRELQTVTGTKFYTPFFITSPDAHRDYWFVHLSSHSRARDEMIKLHWRLQNRFSHYGGAGLNMLGYNPKYDDALTGQGGFFFDDHAEKRARQALCEELPRALAERFTHGESFDTICSAVANETPSPRSFYHDAIIHGVNEGELEILDSESGKKRRAGIKIIKPADIIRSARQIRIFRS